MKSKKGKKKKYQYSEEFKRSVLAKVQAGESVQSLADTHEIGTSMIYTWMKKAGVAPPRKLSQAGDSPPDAYHTIKVAAAFLKNAIRAWDTPRCKPLVELAMIELEEAL